MPNFWATGGYDLFKLQPTVSSSNTMVLFLAQGTFSASLQLASALFHIQVIAHFAVRIPVLECCKMELVKPTINL